MLPRRVVEVPAVHTSETVVRSDLLPASAFRGGWWPLTLVAHDAGQELAFGIRLAPGVGLEPLAPDGLHQRCQVAILAGLLERGVRFVVVPPGMTTDSGPRPRGTRTGGLHLSRPVVEDRSESTAFDGFAYG